MVIFFEKFYFLGILLLSALCSSVRPDLFLLRELFMAKSIADPGPALEIQMVIEFLAKSDIEHSKQRYQLNLGSLDAYVNFMHVRTFRRP
jgi:hypothetical protein